MSDEQDSFKKMIEDSQDWFWEFDEHANFTYVSPRIKDLLGYEPEELIGLNAFDLMDEEEAERVHQHFDPIAEKYLPFNHLENINLHKDGHEVVIESSGTPIFDEDGRFRGYRGIDRDITQRKRMTRELQESRAKLQSILETSSEWIWEIDLSGKHTYSNHRVFDFLGYRPEEFVGRDYFDFLHEDDLLEVKQALPHLITEKRGWKNWILRWRHKNGSYRHLESNAKPIIDDSGEVKGFSGADRDVTERIFAEKVLMKRKRLFRDFFESNPTPTIITSPSGRVHMINPAFARASGFSDEEVVGRTVQELGFWRNPADRERMVAAIREHGQINNMEAELFPKDGQVKTCLVSSQAIEYEGEARILNILLDMTEQKKADEALRKLDQAKSEFIKLAAHELQTPLVAVMGYAELLEASDQACTNEQRQTYASIILSNAETLSRLVKDLLDVESIQLGHRLGVVRENVSLVALIEKSISAMSQKYPNHSFISTHAGNLPELMRIDDDRIAQVMGNLLDNAAKYSPEGSRIEVSTTSDGRMVTVSIRDQGLGMTPDQVEQAFDKFYRANPADPRVGGLGLGLHIVKQIVEDHSGEISIDSSPRAGTTVTFTLPIE